ncbi:MAG: hypothetical protein DME22_23755 [Verrucomicrobia bacterium]|nr:MAG: hypothetical protein DME22_23755 [Verrucomicrobiota bacterium]PYJ95037.1 MAG: hypothetical protein DME23_24480 [Verrucomicrobiota bacterium]
MIHKGANYGYAEREGIEQLFVSGNATINGKTGSQLAMPFPTNSDSLTVTGTVGSVTPVYPVATYSHWDGDAISSGFVYRGWRMPQLHGKYIFGDIPNGRLFYCELADMIANDDGNRTSLAAIHELQVVFDSPYDSPDQGRVKRRLFDIVAEEYHHKGGTASALPGGANTTDGNDPDGVPYGRGRADIRLAVDREGEIYLLSKSDGMVRLLVSLVLPDFQGISVSNRAVSITWSAIPGLKYRLEHKQSLDQTNWSDILPDVTARAPSVDTTFAPDSSTQHFFRVVLVP